MASTPREQVDLVYRQMARTAGFRGFKPRFLYRTALGSGVATAGLVAVSRFVSPRGVVIGWVACAALIAVATTMRVLFPALRSESAIEQETVRAVIAGMLPPLGVGATVTAAVLLRYPEGFPLLPAVWLALFGLGISAIRPLLFASTDHVVIGYLVAAGIAFLLRSADPTTLALLVGIPFTTLHLVTGVTIQAAAPETRRSR